MPPGEVMGVGERFAATPFDIEGAGVFWTHRGELCTFDVMVEEFGLDGVEPLAHLARIVRGADTARLDLAPEAPGLLAVSLGLSRMFADDLAQLEAGLPIYDAFYRWCRDATGETHDWPGAPARDRPRAGGAPAAASAPHGVTLADAIGVWAQVAALSFGGPAGQIAVMHRIVVEEKRWVGERRFLQALNFCMLLPGPEAHQLTIYLGWLLNGVRGGLIAGTLFVLPGFLAMLGLGAIYAAFGQTPLVSGLFFGLKAAVLAIVVQAVVRTRAAGARQRPAARGRRGGVPRDLRLRRALPVDRGRGRSGGLDRHAARVEGISGAEDTPRLGRPRRRRFRPRRRHAGTRAARAPGSDRPDDPARALAGAGRGAGAGPRPRQRLRAARGLLQPDGGRDVRRRLRGARLRGAGGSAGAAAG